MHHDPSSGYMIYHALPSPEYTGDSDSESDIIQETEHKRRQLDEEIARFKALKDKEFRDFEADLKARRRQKRGSRQFSRPKNDISYYEFTKNSPSATPPASASTMFSGYEKKAQSPNTHHQKQPEPIRLTNANAGSKVTPPTICLDKMHIKGENAPQAHVNQMPTPPTPTTIIPATCTDPTAADSASLGRISPKDTTPISPDEKRDNAFAGLFVPTYLPLLSGNNGISRPIEGTQTEPASPTEPSMTAPLVTVVSTSLPAESSIPTDLLVPSARRAYTSPSAVSRGTLTPIIRNMNGRKRSSSKRKHVTFQLADRAIVEPSSSYEEGPSPDVQDGEDGRDSNDSVASTSSATSTEDENDQPARSKIRREKTPLDLFGRRKRTVVPEDTPEAEVGMSMGDLLLGSDQDSPSSSPLKASSSHLRSSAEIEPDGYFSPKHNIHSPTSVSPEKSPGFGSVNDDAYMSKRKDLLKTRQLERKNSRSPVTSPGASRQVSNESSSTVTLSSSHTSHSTTKTTTTTSQSPHLSPHSPHFSPNQTSRFQNASTTDFPSHQSTVTRPMSTHSRYPGTLEDNLLDHGNNVGFFELDEELASPEAGVPKPELAEDKDDGHSSQMKKGGRSEEKSPSRGYVATGTSVPINIVKTGSWGVNNSWIGTFGH